MEIGVASTVDQLPSTAEEYYSKSVKSGLFDYVQIGTDYCGRKVYELTLDGSYYDTRALLKYSEFEKEVKYWLKFKGLGIGVRRWVSPFYSP
jgi:hypothetical protein